MNSPQGTQQYELRNRPVQIVHSFEGLINALDGQEVMPSYGRPRPFLTDNFEARVREELEALAAKGVGGIAVNVGYDGYLENEEGWKRFVRGVEMAVEMGFRIWIYDENGYPSGSAGGLTTKDHPEFEATGLKKIEVDKPGTRISLPHPRAKVFQVYTASSDGRRLLSVQQEGTEVILPDGNYEKVEVYFTAPLFEGTHAGYKITSRKPYVNVLDAEAVNRFLSVTHIQYFKHLPAHLWQHVQAVFTDEPSVMSYALRPEADTNYQTAVPWSRSLEDEFFKTNGYLIQDHILSLFGGSAEEDKKIRRDFWKVASRMYEQAFAVQSSEICEAIGIGLSGHLLAEENIWQHFLSQVNSISLLQHFQLPGIDFLTCSPELVNKVYPITLKLGLSAAVLGGKRDLMVEVGEYCEYWTEERMERLQKIREYWEGPRNANSIEDIKYTLATLFMAGVREYCFYFAWRAYSDEEYKELTAFVERMNRLGRGNGLQPACALYLPYEAIWEEYIPNDKDGWTTSLEMQTDRVKNLNEVMTETCRALTAANVQYILVDRANLSKLQKLGIRTLLYPAGESPDSEVQDVCRQMDVEIILLSGTDTLTTGQKAALSYPGIEAGDGVVYHLYDGFAFVINTTRDEASFTLTGPHDIAFPTKGEDRKPVEGTVNLAPLEACFVFLP